MLCNVVELEPLVPPRLKEFLASIGSAPSRDQYDLFISRAQEGLEAIGNRGECVRICDVSDQLPQEIPGIISSLVPNCDLFEQSIFAWPFEHVAAPVDTQAAFEIFDDLWYPASDDLVIEIPGSLIYVSHEEILSILTVS